MYPDIGESRDGGSSGWIGLGVVSAWPAGASGNGARRYVGIQEAGECFGRYISDSGSNVRTLERDLERL